MSQYQKEPDLKPNMTSDNSHHPLELSFYRTKDGNQSVQVLQDYYQMKEQDNEPIHYDAIPDQNPLPRNSHDYPELTNESVIVQLKMQKRNKFFFWRKKDKTQMNEFTQLNHLFHEANHMKDRVEQYDVLNTLSMHIDDRIDQVENHCITQAGVLTLLTVMFCFFPVVIYSIQLHIHENHPFLWNFIPPVIALTLVLSIMVGITVGKNYFEKKSLKLKKHKHYAAYLNDFFSHSEDD